MTTTLLTYKTEMDTQETSCIKLKHSITVCTDGAINITELSTSWTEKGDGLTSGVAFLSRRHRLIHLNLLQAFCVILTPGLGPRALTETFRSVRTRHWQVSYVPRSIRDQVSPQVRAHLLHTLRARLTQQSVGVEAISRPVAVITGTNGGKYLL